MVAVYQRWWAESHSRWPVPPKLSSQVHVSFSVTHWLTGDSVLPSLVPLGEIGATQHVIDSRHPIRARRCGFSPALSAPPRKLSACCPRESLTERLQSLRPPPPTNSPQGKSWHSSCQPGVGKTAQGREYSKDGRANALMGGSRVVTQWAAASPEGHQAN